MSSINEEELIEKDKKCKDLSLKHLKYLFGDYPDELLEKLSYDYISIYSITPADLAYKLTLCLEECCNKILKKNMNESIITEMTACIGGNVISFAHKFKHVNAIELCEERFNYLNKNLELFNLNNKVTTINGDSMIEIANLKQDIIFFDIPWGGRSYKYKEKINLYISKIPSYDACDLVREFTKILVMKIPNNFNLGKFISRLNSFEIYEILDFDKFKLLILI